MVKPLACSYVVNNTRTSSVLAKHVYELTHILGTYHVDVNAQWTPPFSRVDHVYSVNNLCLTQTCVPF